MFKSGMTVKNSDGAVGTITNVDAQGFVSVKYKDGSSERLGSGVAAASLTPVMPLWEKVAIGTGVVGGVGLLALIVRSLSRKS